MVCILFWDQCCFLNSHAFTLDLLVSSHLLEFQMKGRSIHLLGTQAGRLPIPCPEAIPGNFLLAIFPYE